MTMIKTAYDISRKQVFFCSAKDPITKVAELLYTNNVGSVLVKEKETVRGIITVNDMLKQIAWKRNPAETLARDIMSSPVVMANKDMEIDELVEKFNKHRVSRMVLVDEKENIVGVVRDIAVFKYMTFFKYDKEARKMFAKDYLHKLY